MARYLLPLTVFALAGCPSGKLDSGDTSSSGDGPLIEEFDGNCADGACTWYVAATAEIGSVDLYLWETGDPSFTCGPAAGDKSISCGVWQEFHTSFVDAGTIGGNPAKSISLDLVSSAGDQVDNTSTLFDMNDSDISNQIGVYWEISDADGNYSDCAVYYSTAAVSGAAPTGFPSSGALSDCFVF